MSHDNDKYFDNLSEEALIANLLSLFHHGLYLLPDPLFTTWIGANLRGMHRLLTEERLNKL